MPVYERYCQFCGKPFTAFRSNKIFCQKRCAILSSKQNRGITAHIDPFTKLCSVCGKEFETYRAATTTCSTECSKARKRSVDRERHKSKGGKTWEEYIEECKHKSEETKANKSFEKIQYKNQHTVIRECVICGNTFSCLDAEPNKTCSRECSAELKRKRHDKRIPQDQRVDRISLKALFKRDNGKCYLCGCTCDWNSWKVSKSGAKYPGDTYPTIDHLVPVSRGGLDSWENVRLACWSCNIHKSNGVIQTSAAGRPEFYGRNDGQKKRTAQYTLEGILVRVWESTAQIKRETGLSDKAIQNVCRGEHKSAFGYKWEYVS